MNHSQYQGPCRKQRHANDWNTETQLSEIQITETQYDVIYVQHLTGKLLGGEQTHRQTDTSFSSTKNDNIKI